jgi:hypothetical protein
MNGIQVQVAGAFKTAKPLRTPRGLTVKVNQEYSEFTIPQLSDYELVVIE